MFEIISRLFKKSESAKNSSQQSSTTESDAPKAEVRSGNDELEATPSAQIDNEISKQWHAKRITREAKSSRASATYWSQGASRYRRKAKPSPEMLPFNGYFEAIKTNADLRNFAFQDPGSMLDELEHEDLSSIVAYNVKERLLARYVHRGQLAVSRASMPPLGEDRTSPDASNAAHTYMCEVTKSLKELKTSVEEVVRMADFETQSALAECTDLSEEVMELMAKGESLDVRYSVSENYSCPIRILCQLSEDLNPYIAHRASLTLRRLSDSGVDISSFTSSLDEPEVLNEIPEAPLKDGVFEESKQLEEAWRVPPTIRETEILSELFEHNEGESGDYSKWLLNLAESANTKSIERSVADEVIWLLISDENLDVRFALAENYNVDEEMLDALSRDENPYVAHRAQKTLARLRPASVMNRDFTSRKSESRQSG